MRTVTVEDIQEELRTLKNTYPQFQLIEKPITSTRCTTFCQTIYVSTDWRLLPPSSQYTRLKHEAVHLAQYARLGLFQFGWRYVTNAGRFTLESEAFAAEMAALYEIFGVDILQNRRTYFIEQLSGKAYYHCASSQEATLWCDRVISHILSPVG